MKIYLDTCCWNRPFDDQSQNRVRLEAEAVLSILEMAQANELEIIGSDIIDDELSQLPDNERREKTEQLLTLISSHATVTSAIEQRAMELTKSQIDPLDALHLASAENARADYFLTTDDAIQRFHALNLALAAPESNFSFLTLPRSNPRLRQFHHPLKLLLR